MKNLSLVIPLLIISIIGHAQNVSQSKSVYEPDHGAVSNFVNDTMILNQIFYNGKVWVGSYYDVYGTEFMIADDWMQTDIIINNILFKNVKIKYDIYNDDILANYNNKRIIILNPDNIDHFTVYTDNKEFRFENLHDNYELEGYFQVLYDGKNKLYKKWKKKRAQFAVEARYDEFQPDHKLILLRDSIPYGIKNRRDILKIMNERKADIKNFIKHENIRIDVSTPENLIPLMKYLDNM